MYGGEGIVLFDMWIGAGEFKVGKVWGSFKTIGECECMRWELQECTLFRWSKGREVGIWEECMLTVTGTEGVRLREGTCDWEAEGKGNWDWKFVRETIYARNLADGEELDNNIVTWMKGKHDGNQGYWQVVVIVGQGEFPGVEVARLKDQGQGH